MISNCISLADNHLYCLMCEYAYLYKWIIVRRCVVWIEGFSLEDNRIEILSLLYKFFLKRTQYTYLCIHVNVCMVSFHEYIMLFYCVFM